MSNTITSLVAIPVPTIAGKTVPIPTSFPTLPTPIGRWQADYNNPLRITGGSFATGWNPSVATSPVASLSAPVNFRPIYSTEFNGLYGILFDGANDYFVSSSSAFMVSPGSTGSMSIVFECNAIGIKQILFSSSTSIASSGDCFDVGISASGNIFVNCIQNSGTEINYAEGAFVCDPNTKYVLILRSTADTKQWTLFMNGASDALTYSSITTRTNKWPTYNLGNQFSLGAKRENSATTVPLSGSIADAAFWRPMLTDQNVTDLNRMLSDRWIY